MKKQITFILNNRLIETQASAGTVLLDFIRKESGLPGTKEVCKEGDCGACCILFGELNSGKVVYKTIASCLTPIGDLHGKHIVSIEGINRDDGETPIQEEFIKEGASQCGFCTPGFIISLTSYFINSPKLTFQDAMDAMDGNICRCTGYMSIKRAAKNLSDKYSKLLDKNIDRISQLIEWELVPNYFSDIADRLTEITKTDMNLKAEDIHVGGGTDLFVQQADSLIDEELDFIDMIRPTSIIKEETGQIILCSNTTITDLRDSPIIQKYLPELKGATDLIASTMIRNRATVSGNIVNASPIGDISIIMLALGAKLTIKSNHENSRIMCLKDFYLGYKQVDLKKDEYIDTISFPIPESNNRFSFEKVSKRKYLDIASVNSSIFMETDGTIIKKIRLSAGGVWAYPLLLTKTSEYLIGKDLTPQNIKDAAMVINSEIAPIDDVRGAAEYKSLLLRQLFFAHFIKLFKDEIKLGDLL